MKLSTTEELALNFLRNEYGAVAEALPKEEVNAHILQAQTEFNYQTTQFYNNQSSVNYRLLVNAMVHLQYWNQKSTEE